MAVAVNGFSKPSFRKSYSIEYGYKPRKRTLIADAEFDRVQHDEEQQEQKKQQQHEENTGNAETKTESIYTILVTIKDRKSASILNLINTFNRDGLKVQHLETRPVATSPTQKQLPEGKDDRASANIEDVVVGLDVFMELCCTDKLMDDLKRVLFQSEAKFIVKNIKAHAAASDASSTANNKERIKDEVIWFPMSIWELDRCHHLHTNYQPDMDSRHPGFTDKAYRARREHIAQIAFSFRHGDAIPKVEYTPDEVKTWG